MLLVAGLPLDCTVPRQLRKYAQLTRAMHPNTLFVRPVFNRSRPDGSSALACRVVPRRLPIRTSERGSSSQIAFATWAGRSGRSNAALEYSTNDFT